MKTKYQRTERAYFVYNKNYELCLNYDADDPYNDCVILSELRDFYDFKSIVRLIESEIKKHKYESSDSIEMNIDENGALYVTFLKRK